MQIHENTRGTKFKRNVFIENKCYLLQDDLHISFARTDFVIFIYQLYYVF